MSARITALADAVVAFLNAGMVDVAATAALQATRAYVAEFDLVTLGETKVTVVARKVESERADRARMYRDIEIDIAVQEKLPAKEVDRDARADVLMIVTEAIDGLLQDETITAGEDEFRWVRSSMIPYSSDHLRNKSVFTSVITATYRMIG